MATPGRILLVRVCDCMDNRETDLGSHGHTTGGGGARGHAGYVYESAGVDGSFVRSGFCYRESDTDTNAGRHIRLM